MKTITTCLLSLILSLSLFAQNEQYNYYMTQGKSHQDATALSYYQRALKEKPDDTLAIFQCYATCINWANTTRKIEPSLEALFYINMLDSIQGRTHYYSRGIAEMVYAHNLVSKAVFSNADKATYQDEAIKWYEKSISDFEMILSMGDKYDIHTLADTKQYLVTAKEARDRLKYD